MREKLPELLVEATSVVFAVLLALAVDEWRDSQAVRREALRARAAIEHEMRSNVAELDEMLAGNQAALERLRAALDEDVERTVVGLDYQLAELSGAAWQSAQLTGAAAGLDLDWVIAAARLYEIQRLYADGQRQLVDRLAGMGEAIGDSDPEPVLRGLAGRVQSLLNLSQALRQRYAELLDGIGEGQDNTG